MARSLVVIPTYNEADNIQKMIPAILRLAGDFEVLVVDDNSPDGTAELVRGIQAEVNRVHLIVRPGKMGLGTAYVAGFKFALRNGFDYIFEMDADFSHDPHMLPKMLEKTQEADLILGSRYCAGINVVNWPMKRLLLSYFANIYTRIITGMPIADATGGFKCYARKVLVAINIDSIRSNGYAFQIETTFKAWSKGFRILEIPIVFVDRRVGISKMSKKIVREAIWMVWKMKFKSLFDGKP
jgi:dolichol-phosphate mannosyltransferase